MSFMVLVLAMFKGHNICFYVYFGSSRPVKSNWNVITQSSYAFEYVLIQLRRYINNLPWEIQTPKPALVQVLINRLNQQPEELLKSKSEQYQVLSASVQCCMNRSQCTCGQSNETEHSCLNHSHCKVSIPNSKTNHIRIQNHTYTTSYNLAYHLVFVHFWHWVCSNLQWLKHNEHKETIQKRYTTIRL